MSIQSEINETAASARAAMLAGDYRSALELFLCASSMIDDNPDIQRGQDSLTYRPGAYKSQIEYLQRRVNAASGIQSASIRWKEPSA